MLNSAEAASSSTIVPLTKARASPRHNAWRWQEAHSRTTVEQGGSGIMQLTEQHVIKRKDPRFAVIDAAAFASKNLYNAALYEMRQAFIHEGIYLSYEEMDQRMQPHEAYKALPAKRAQHVLKQLADAWKAFREAKAVYEEDPSRFTGRPRLPKYKHKTEGRNLLIYTMQAVSRGKRSLQRGIIKPFVSYKRRKDHLRRRERFLQHLTET